MFTENRLQGDLVGAASVAIGGGSDPGTEWKEQAYWTIEAVWPIRLRQQRGLQMLANRRWCPI